MDILYIVHRVVEQVLNDNMYFMADVIWSLYMTAQDMNVTRFTIGSMNF